MAEKVLQTRIINKHGLLTEWESSTLQLREGEIALAKVMVPHTDGTEVPTYIAKVGIEGKTFAESPMFYAPASDVYQWAKAATKPSYHSGEIARGTSTVAADLTTIEGEITTLKTAIGEGGSVESQIASAITTALDALDFSELTVGTGKVISTVKQENGKVTVTTRDLAKEDIPTIEIAQVNGLQAALDAKAAATEITRLEGVIADASSTAATATKKVADDLAEYETDNDARSDAIEAAAEALAGRVTTAEGKITTAEGKITAAEGAIASEVSAREAAISGLAGEGRTTETVKGNADAIAKLAQDIGNVANVMNFRGVSVKGEGTTPGHDITDPKSGDVIIYGEAEYVYNGTEWVKFGDASDNATAIADLQGRMSAVEATNASQETAIEAAQGDATQALADAKTANDAIAVINGSGEGSLAQVLVDAKAYADTAESNAVATAKGYTDTEVKKASDAAEAAQTAINNHKDDKNNPHGVTATQIGVGAFENKTFADIKSDFEGSVAEGNTGFVKGGDVYTAITNGDKAVDDKVSALATTVNTSAVRVKGDNLVYGEEDTVIIFDCGGPTA